MHLIWVAEHLGVRLPVVVVVERGGEGGKEGELELGLGLGLCVYPH